MKIHFKNWLIQDKTYIMKYCHASTLRCCKKKSSAFAFSNLKVAKTRLFIKTLLTYMVKRFDV